MARLIAMMGYIVALKKIKRKWESNRKLKISFKKEINGPSGVEPTRYGDWEKKGIISDF